MISQKKYKCNAALNDFARILNYIENPEVYNPVANQLLWGLAGGLIGAYTKGRSGAAWGTVLGAVAGYCTTQDYPSLINNVRKLSGKEKQKLWAEMALLIGSFDFEYFLKWWETSSNQEKLLKLLQAAIRAHQIYQSPNQII